MNHEDRWLRIVSAPDKIAGLDAALTAAARTASRSQIAAVAAVTAGGRPVVIMTAADFGAAFVGNAPIDRQIAAEIAPETAAQPHSSPTAPRDCASW